MNPRPSTRPASQGMVLALAILGLAACQALPTLVQAWGDDRYARGAPLAFGIWLAPQGILFFKNRHLAYRPCLAWLGVSLLLGAAGSMTGLRVLQHLALACAVPGVLGLRLLTLTVLAATPAWLPATGWFLSHGRAGGLGGWERPASAAIMALLLLALARRPIQPSHFNHPNP